MNLAELLVIPASMFPEREIVRFDGNSTSYAELQDRVARTAAALAQLGIRPGDRIAVLQTNTPDVVSVLFAAATLGAVFVPLNYRARREELEHLLRVAAPRLLLTGDRYLDLAFKAIDVLTEPAQVVTLEQELLGVPRLSSLANDMDGVYPEEVEDDDPAVIMFTSGTSENAKAVLLTHSGLVNFAFGAAEPIDGDDHGKVLLAAPIYHVAGLSAVLTATFAGRTIVLMHQFDAAEWLRLVAAERVTHAFLVPTMLKRVLEHALFAETDLSSLQVLSYGAAPMPLSIVRRAIEAFPPEVQFINAFGQTETTSTVTMLDPDDHRLDGTPEEVETKLRRLSSIGRPLQDVEVAILDESGHVLPTGNIGEIVVRSERIMRGYYGEDTMTLATISDGWLHTRDLGWQDEDGYIFLAGRKSDMIIRGGENVAPAEVEAVLITHPGVEDAAVIGLPDEEWGERIAAVVVLRAGRDVSADELIEHVHERLASFKRPDRIFFSDALPRSALGKLLRRELRDLYQS